MYQCINNEKGAILDGCSTLLLKLKELDWVTHLIFVTTITTAGCVKKSVKCKIFQSRGERNRFDIAQNV